MVYKRNCVKSKNYQQRLQSIGSLSGMFSSSDIPYLDYRIAEKIFCQAYDAEDFSRSDISVDAVLDGVGIGLKTFLHHNGRTYQKIAEFNRLSAMLEKKTPAKVVRAISEARNERLQSTADALALHKSIYHLVTRIAGAYLIYEEPMQEISLNRLKLTRRTRSSLYFHDQNQEYLFNTTKSTLFKRFECGAGKFLDQIPIKLISDPLSWVARYIGSSDEPQTAERWGTYGADYRSIVLPLYSVQGGTRHVPPKSGLNQWNASGRNRNVDEVYIPVPIAVHKNCDGFFPNNTTDRFQLELPSGEVLEAKLCQGGAKGLMSNPNKNLGRWLLRDVLRLRPGTLANIDQLNTIGIDSVLVTKKSDKLYRLDFARSGSYEDFQANGYVI